MFVHVNHINIYYEVHGSGRPLLMVHGNGEDHTIFKEAVEVLQKHFTCYVIDSRGHGRSSDVPILHYSDMAQDILAFLEALELSDVIFYGFSDGGILGLLATPACPRITTLIVSGANLTPRGVKKSLALLLRFLNFVKHDPKIELMVKEPNISSDFLKKIAVPTLVLAGSEDLILEEETRRIAAGIPNSTLRILPGEKHGSYIVHSEKIAELILEFCL